MENGGSDPLTSQSRPPLDMLLLPNSPGQAAFTPARCVFCLLHFALRTLPSLTLSPPLPRSWRRQGDRRCHRRLSTVGLVLCPAVRRRRALTTRYAPRPFTSLLFLLRESEHPNPNLMLLGNL